MNNTVSIAEQDHIVVITIERPDVMNALDPQTHIAMSNALDAFENNPNLRVAIITGSGNKAFCAGGDISVMATAVKEEDYYVPPTGYGGLTRRRSIKPIIIAANGFAFGGGFEMVLTADLVVASEHAVFGLPEPHIGNAAVAGGMHRLPRQIGLKPAMEILLTGEPISAQKALTLGLINAVVPAEEVLDKAKALAKKIMRCAPLAIEATMETVKMGLQYSDEYDAMDAQSRGAFPALEKMRTSQDSSEGLKAFLEKRRPVWKGQ